MKSIRFCAALLLGAFLIPVALPAIAPLQRVARADDATDAATATLKEIYSKRDTLYKNRDMDGVLAYEAPNYTEVDSKGSVREKADADARAKESFAKIPAVESMETTVEDVTIGDEGTTAKTKTVVEFSVNDPNGGTHKVVATNNSTDVWVKNTDAKDGDPPMLLLKSTEVKTVVTFDGKEIPMGDDN